MILPPSIFVADQASLDACVERCRETRAIAVDTEFVRTDTFYPELGLNQISDGESVWLVDPLAMINFDGLCQLLTDQAVVKVFHSCSEDLEVLRYALNIVPQPILDTQVAAAFCGHRFSMGYSALMAEVLDVHLDKHETRSDWLKRPLTSAQMRYAAEDVYFLIKAYGELMSELVQSGRDSWVVEEMADLVEQAKLPESPENYYLRVKGAWKLSPSDLARLRSLTCWREQEARLRNMPRNRIVSDKALLDLVYAKPKKLDDLYRIDGMHRGFIRRYGDTIMEILDAEPELSGLANFAAPLDKEGRALLSDCRQKLSSKAEKLGVAVELIARKKDLEPFVQSVFAGSTILPDRLAKGWRFDLVGQLLLDYVKSRRGGDGEQATTV